MADILVIVKESPLNTIRCTEALRMGLGLTLAENRVAVLFWGDGLYSLVPLRAEKVGRPSSEEFFKYCDRLSVPLLADGPGLADRKLAQLRPGVKVMAREDVLRRIAESPIVIPY